MSDGKAAVQINDDTQPEEKKEGFWGKIKKLSILLPILIQISILFDLFFRRYWAGSAGYFFGVPRDYFYSNFLTEKLITIIGIIVLVTVLISPLIIINLIRLGNKTFQLLFQEQFIFLEYCVFSFFLIITSLIPLSYDIVESLGKIGVTISLPAFRIYLVPVTLLFEFFSWYYIGVEVKKYNASKEQVKLSLKDSPFLVFSCILTLLILITLIGGVYNIRKTPITDKQYEIVEKNDKVFLVVPQTEKETILFEATFLDEAKERLAFERAKYIIGDKKDFEKIEYKKFTDVMPIIPNSKNHKFIKNGDDTYLEYSDNNETCTIRISKANEHLIFQDLKGDKYLQVKSSEENQLIKLIFVDETEEQNLKK